MLLLPRPPRRTRWKPPVHLIPHRLLVVNPLLILAVSALNFPRSGTSPLTARCMADTVQRVVWCTKAMARWLTLPTILTPLTHKVVKCINHVSNSPVMLFFCFVFTRIGKSCERKTRKKGCKESGSGVFFLVFSLFVSKWDFQLIDDDGFQKTNQPATHNKPLSPSFIILFFLSLRLHT